ncbi:flagellar hook-basal body protein [Candidatus Margulisiibacteriota bacterium]
MSDPILEVGGAGIESTDAKVKVLMNNMVNSETPGFRRADAVIQSFPTYLDAAQNRSTTQIPKVETIRHDQTPGTLLRTGNKLDVAIGGDGFFVIETPAGRGYTRDGRFTLDMDGRVVTTAGNHPVVGEGGPISISPGSEIEVTGTGEILVDGVKEDQLRVVGFKDPSSLDPLSGSTFKATSRANEKIIDVPRVIQGYVETSNVNMVDSMMELVYLSRIYGLNAKIISNRDVMMSRAIEMGRPSQ